MYKIWPQNSRNAWALLPLRLLIGFGFMAHGVSKLSKGPDAFAAILQALGVPLPGLAAWATTFVELVGGLAIFIGAFVSLASIPLIIVMLVALFTVHLPYGFSSIKLMAMTPNGPQFGTPGYELNLLYIVGLIALILGGPTPFSVDAVLARRNKSSEISES